MESTIEDAKPEVADNTQEKSTPATTLRFSMPMDAAYQPWAGSAAPMQAAPHPAPARQAAPAPLGAAAAAAAEFQNLPKTSDGFYHRGLTFLALGNSPGTIAALRRATELRPGMAEAWRTLGDTLMRGNDMPGARTAYATYRSLASQPATPPAPLDGPPAAAIQATEQAWVALISGMPEQALETVLRANIRANITDVAAMRALAEFLASKGDRPGAEALLARALSIAPHYTGARKDYAYLLFNMARFADALPHFERLIADKPETDGLNRILLAVCLGNVGDYDRAIALFESAASLRDSQTLFMLTYADMLKYVGRREDSARAYRHCLEIAPGAGRVWWALADLKNETLTAADLQAMQSQLARTDITPEDRYNIHYAIARALEQTGDYENSFAHYAKGAALKRAEVGYNAAELPALTQRAKAFYTPARFAACQSAGCADPAPIFIVGLPRAGSTLVEQILASHSAVEGTRELPDIGVLASEIGGADGARYPERLAAYENWQLAELGEKYIHRTRIYRKTGRPFFIDKLPANWAHAGFIHMILPNAKIIDVRRHPVAGCFAAYKQLFGRGVHYSYDLNDVAGYYLSYIDRMAHFDRVMPGRIHRVIYEKLVEDTETQIRALLDYCQLGFEPACLRFWESKRAVATPSAEQVRQPIFRSGLDQWRKYEPWLAPLQKALDLPASDAWDK